MVGKQIIDLLCHRVVASAQARIKATTSKRLCLKIMGIGAHKDLRTPAVLTGQRQEQTGTLEQASLTTYLGSE